MCTHDQLSTDSGLSILFEMLYLVVFFYIGIHSMQGWAATTRHGVTRKGSTKRLRIQEISLERTYS